MSASLGLDTAERSGTGVRERRELRDGWPAILACFAVAVLGWGLGFYGQAVYLAELQRLHGWSASLISGATTLYYFAGALLLVFVHGGIERFGPRRLLMGGAFVLGAAAILIGRAAAPWQLYLGYLLLSAGWACTSSTAITTTLALWFDRRRGLAISLALNGASASGFTVAPALVYLSQRRGLPAAATIVVLVLLALVLPLVAIALGRRPRSGEMTARRAEGAEPATPSEPGVMGRAAALRHAGFWTIAAPFALGLAAQVGFIVHQVAFLLPTLGAGATGILIAGNSAAAVVGRVALGLVIDRLDQRLTSALAFASQAAALAAMIAWPGTPAVLVPGCLIFGLSVGNVITLPALIIQREFPARAFGMLIGLSTAIGQFTYAFGPTLVGLAHDLGGGYGPALGLCAALDLAAGGILLAGRRGMR